MKKKLALITGASSGIGEELARIHAKNNGDVILVARSEKKLEDLKNELESTYKIKAFVIPCDLSNPNNCDKLFEDVKSKGLTIDYLINNAGISKIKKFDDFDWEYLQNMININVTSLTKLTKLFLQDLKMQAGKVLNVASTASFQAIPNQAVYAATKAYVLSFSEGIAEELKKHKVTISVLCPGPTKTNIEASNAVKLNAVESKLIMASPYDVALHGYKAMINNKRVAIPGFLNKCTAKTVGFLPRNIVTKLSGKLFEHSLKENVN